MSVLRTIGPLVSEIQGISRFITRVCERKNKNNFISAKGAPVGFSVVRFFSVRILSVNL